MAIKKNQYSEMAKSIVQILLCDPSDSKHAMSLYDLVALGVDGELLREVVDILDKSNHVFNTAQASAFEETVKNNIKECETLLRRGLDEAVLNEWTMLKEKPKVLIGIQYDKNNDRLQEADSGIPLGLNKYTATSAALLRSSVGEESRRMILLDGELKTFDGSDFTHNNLN